jgi:phosphoglycolate phosphatase
VNSPNARAVIWDLDGTLVDSAADLAAALNGVLGRRGLEPRTLEAVRGMIGDGVTELVRRGVEAAGRPLTSAEVPSLRREFMARYGECATRETRPMHDAAEVLATLADAGWHHAVCSNKPAGISGSILEALGLSRWIDTVVGGDEELPLKPDPAPVHACLEALGLAPDQAVMVGDSVNDAAAARAAGVPVVFVRSGYGRSPGTDPDADACVDGLGEVPPIVTRLLGAGGSSHP